MKRFMIFIAGILRLFAGFFVTRIGVRAYTGKPLYAIFSLLIFLIFYMKIFAPMVKKNEKRIREMDKKDLKFRKFMDKKSYFIMIFMITLGIVLRKFAGLPALFFFILYNGIGVALFSAGVRYISRFIRRNK